ncbi:MAG: hypothetical protein ACPL3C_02340 [Pyrobaculum sp.]
MNKTEIRRRNLGLLVGGRYFRYYRQPSIKIIESLMRRAGEEAVAASFRDLALEALKYALGLLKIEVERALRDRLVYREFGVVYGADIEGAIDVARSIAVRPLCLVASLTYLPSRHAPEYLLMRRIAREVITTARRMAAGDEEAVRLLEGIAKLLRHLPAGTTSLECGDVEYIEWLRRACLINKFVKALERSVKIGRAAGLGEEVVFRDWRLYEIYTYFLIYDVFKSAGFEEAACRDAGGGEPDLTLKKGDKCILIYFNKPLAYSLVERYNGNDASLHRGRPDVFVEDGSVKIVVEAKFSTSPSYIALGRFKAMAYMYEYSADAGILIFPAIEGVPTDEEERSIAELYKYVEKEGVATLHLRDGRNLHLIRIDPAETEDPYESDRLARERLRRVLKIQHIDL